MPVANPHQLADCHNTDPSRTFEPKYSWCLNHSTTNKKYHEIIYMICGTHIKLVVVMYISMYLYGIDRSRHFMVKFWRHDVLIEITICYI
jgi:hypothetical protein